MRGPFLALHPARCLLLHGLHFSLSVGNTMLFPALSGLPQMAALQGTLPSSHKPVESLSIQVSQLNDLCGIPVGPLMDTPVS